MDNSTLENNSKINNQMIVSNIVTPLLEENSNSLIESNLIQPSNKMATDLSEPLFETIFQNLKKEPVDTICYESSVLEDFREELNEISDSLKVVNEINSEEDSDLEQLERIYQSVILEQNAKQGSCIDFSGSSIQNREKIFSSVSTKKHIKKGTTKVGESVICSIDQCTTHAIYEMPKVDCHMIDVICSMYYKPNINLIDTEQSYTFCAEHLEMVEILITCQLCGNKLVLDLLSMSESENHEAWNLILSSNNVDLELRRGMFTCFLCQSKVLSNPLVENLDKFKPIVNKRKETLLKLFVGTPKKQISNIQQGSDINTPLIVVDAKPPINKLLYTFLNSSKARKTKSKQYTKKNIPESKKDVNNSAKMQDKQITIKKRKLVNCSVYKCNEHSVYEAPENECNVIKKIILSLYGDNMNLIEINKCYNFCAEHLVLIEILRKCQFCGDKISKIFNRSDWIRYHLWSKTLSRNNISLEFQPGMLVCMDCQIKISRNQMFSNLDKLILNLKERKKNCMKLRLKDVNFTNLKNVNNSTKMQDKQRTIEKRKLVNCSVYLCNEHSVYEVPENECNVIKKIILSLYGDNMNLIEINKCYNFCAEHLVLIEILRKCQFCGDKISKIFNRSDWIRYNYYWWSRTLCRNNISSEFQPGMLVCMDCQIKISRNQMFSNLDKLILNLKERKMNCMKLNYLFNPLKPNNFNIQQRSNFDTPAVVPVNMSPCGESIKVKSKNTVSNSLKTLKKSKGMKKKNATNTIASMEVNGHDNQPSSIPEVEPNNEEAFFAKINTEKEIVNPLIIKVDSALYSVIHEFLCDNMNVNAKAQNKNITTIEQCDNDSNIETVYTHGHDNHPNSIFEVELKHKEAFFAKMSTEKEIVNPLIMKVENIIYPIINELLCEDLNKNLELNNEEEYNVKQKAARSLITKNKNMATTEQCDDSNVKTVKTHKIPTITLMDDNTEQCDDESNVETVITHQVTTSTVMDEITDQFNYNFDIETVENIQESPIGIDDIITDIDKILQDEILNSILSLIKAGATRASA